MQIWIKFWQWFFKEGSDFNKPRIDYVILTSIILLTAYGVLMIFSASIAYAKLHGGAIYYYLIRQVIALAIAGLLGVGAFFIPSDFWRRNANIIVAGVILLLLMVLIPHIGHIVNGSRRWLPIGLINLQPSEFAKLGMVIYLANYLSAREINLNKLTKDIIPLASCFFLVSVLLLLEPDLGSVMVIFVIGLSLLYLANLNKRVIIGVIMGGWVLFILLIVFEPYRMKRVIGFLNPWEDALGKGYQLTHSLLAYGHGGLLGVGLGNSLEKLYYLPEAHTDFILSIIAEEFGVLGVLLILLLFWIIFYRGFLLIAPLAKRLPGRKFQSLLAQGISVWVLAQVLINIGVTIGLLPTKGLTLPLISFGGSSLVIMVVSLAILLKIDYENKLIRKGLFKLSK